MSSSRRLYEIDKQHKNLLLEQEELYNPEDGGDEAFVIEEEEDDEHKRQKASHSRLVMQDVGQISKSRRAANLDGKREIRDQVDEIERMGKSIVLESLMRFCSAIEALYNNEYIQKPTTMDLRRLLKKGMIRDFRGMIGSIDCMHWT
ncbi:uncharacterized protein LOC126608634 [Malus sylvestris]|uniref:uncharacterized protein LOC126608634 n=1 Tax=Malus sylvestris TaxID=3752 RepID=UPI0021ABDE1D|nr:uncharacterized protein LOC126608634 [Malus sylvestris]